MTDTPTGSPSFVSRVFRDIPAPDFADVVIEPIPAGAETSARIWADAVFCSASAPILVRALMGLRQAAVRIVGIPAGDKNAFAVREVVGQEALIAVDDAHLDFRCGVGVDPQAHLLRVTTAVRLKGWRGRLYFAVVGPLHPIVLRAMMRRAIRRRRPR